MPESLETREEQIKVIEVNAERIITTAKKGYKDFKEKGTVVILKQLENNSSTLEDWQIVYKPMSLLPNVLSDWKEAGLQDLIIKYNPEASVICTFLYPNGAHTSYHFSMD